MNVTGLVGSPRKGMNTDILVDQVLAGAAGGGATVEKIYLNDLTIRPCQACPREAPNLFCNLRDDMDMIFGKLERADGVVLGSPVYFETVTAQVKLMIDRCGCCADLRRLADGKTVFVPLFKESKRGIFIGVADRSSNFEPVRAVIRMFFKHLNITIVDEILVNRTGARLAADRPEVLDKAFTAGARLVDDRPLHNSGRSSER